MVLPKVAERRAMDTGDKGTRCTKMAAVESRLPERKTLVRRFGVIICRE